MLQRLGKGFGQKGSTRNMGAPCASMACFCAFFSFASRLTMQIAASAKTQQVPRITACRDARSRFILVFTGLPSVVREKNGAILAEFVTLRTYTITREQLIEE